MTYENFKTLAKEFFIHYGVEMEFLKTGTTNPKYRLVIKGYKVNRIKDDREYNQQLNDPHYVKRAGLPIIPEEIRHAAIRQLFDEKSNRPIYGMEGLSGTDWVAYRSIRMPTSQWHKFAKDMANKINMIKNLDFIKSL